MLIPRGDEKKMSPVGDEALGKDGIAFIQQPEAVFRIKISTVKVSGY
jgi:hypothetical protein